MSQEKEKQFERHIEALVSALASSAKTTTKSEDDYEEESEYVEQLKKNLRSGKEISLVELAQRLRYERDKHDFLAEVGKHGFRMQFLWWLFGLTCCWLLLVVFIVGWTALSPSVGDRERLIQLQSQQLNFNGSATNAIHAAMIRTANPRYCPILFHLSDSVLVAFITSTTVAVLGLFLTAAKWLYGNNSENKPSRADAKKRMPKQDEQSE